MPLLSLSLLLLTLLAVLPAGAAETLDANRVRAVAAMLPEQPAGPGRPLSDRATWERWAAQPDYQAVVARANELLKQPLPEQPDELYLEYSRNGNRTRWQNVANARRSRLTTLVLAEGLENKGRFVPAIEALIGALGAERTWVMPAHDGKLDNFNGKVTDIDLASSALGWNLAMADYLLGDKLGAPARQQLRDNVRRRVLEPYRAMIRGERPANWWLTGTNNWNAVCLAGVTGAGLAQLASREERAEFVVAAEKYSRYFLSGFTADGYCSEGLGYWNYGFGHYALLGETMRRATGGQVDLMALPAAKMPALFGARIQIIGGVAPAFADCPVNAQPSAALMHLINHRFNLGLQSYAELNPKSTFGTLFEAMIYGLDDDAPTIGQSGAVAAAPLRDWFEQAGILIARPAPAAACHLGVALKGGHNAENHNHNDVGSYVVVNVDRAVLLDPGAETYTARTFGPHRYDSKLLNSFGHPVPVVAGKLQREGRAAAAKVLRTEFTPATDTLQLDIASAYPVPELKSLHRTFVYSREGSGALSVTDRVEFSSPQTFGTAVLTRGGWQRQADGSLLVYDGEQALRVAVDTGGAEFAVDAEEIHEDAPVTPTRLGINLKQPVQAAAITLKITPFDLPNDGATPHNGGFETGSLGWELPRDGMASISTEQAASGQASLKISDHDRQSGSNVLSARFAATGGRAYVLRGQIRQVSGEGVGMYVKFFNAAREQVNVVDAKGNIAPAGTAKGAPGRWEPFSFTFQTPPDTTTMQLWIHSFNGAETEAYFDDLSIAPQAP